jgi:hypothetical protein
MVSASSFSAVRALAGNLPFRAAKRPAVPAALLLVLAALAALTGCDLYTYGRIGGADKEETFYPGDGGFTQIMSSLSGVWYSRYAGIGRLDGYRIGVWNGQGDFGELVENSGKTALFPAVVTPYQTYTDESGGPGSDVPAAGDYFVLYDDTVYGEADDTGSPGQSPGSAYCGLVRAVNVFAGDPGRGALVIEYLRGCAPRRDDDIKDGQRPFFGVYYRVLDRDTVQMANTVDLAAMYNGERYSTETAHLAEAVAKHNAGNEAEFVSWGVVIPQDRYK